MATIEKAVDLGLLLNCELISSIDNTRFPTDSVKSDKILLLKLISFESSGVLSKVILFSVAKSKS